MLVTGVQRGGWADVVWLGNCATAARLGASARPDGIVTWEGLDGDAVAIILIDDCCAREQSVNIRSMPTPIWVSWAMQASDLLPYKGLHALARVWFCDATNGGQALMPPPLLGSVHLQMYRQDETFNARWRSTSPVMAPACSQYR